MARRWTDADIEVALAESTERSGVPLHVTDPSVLARVAALARPAAEAIAS